MAQIVRNLDLCSVCTCVRDSVLAYLSAHHLLVTSFPIEQEAHPRCKSGMLAFLSTQILGSPSAVEWSGASNNSFLCSPQLIHPVSSRLGFTLGILSSFALRLDKWVDIEVRLYCIKFGITITPQFPDRMFSLLHLALINAKVC